MLTFCTTEAHRYVIEHFLRGWGKSIAGDVRVVSYGELYEVGQERARSDAGQSPHVFADLERLPTRACELLANYREALMGRGARVYNHPLTYPKRYQLLKTLHERGFNRHNVYRPTEDLSEVCYPVFLRMANDHEGPRSGLIHDRDALDRELEACMLSFGLDDALIVEFLDYRDKNGFYHKYSAYKVGDRLVFGHMAAGKEWMLKTSDVHSADALEREVAFATGQLGAEQISQVFEIAGADFGRLDFTFVEGQVQVFELNSAPYLGAEQPEGHPRYRVWRDTMERVASALRELAATR